MISTSRMVQTAIERPITTLMAFLSIITLGIVSLQRIPVQFLPDIQAPWMGCFVWYQRPLSPEEMERKIIKPIEGEVAGLTGVKNIYGYSHGQWAFLPIQFEFGTNTKFRVIDLQEKLDRFRQNFPKGSMYLEVFPFDTSWDNTQLMQVSVQGPRYDPFLQGINIEKIRKQIEDIDGIAKSEVWGGHDRKIEVAVQEVRMQEHQMPLYRLTNIVRSYTTDPIFLGSLTESGLRHFVRIDCQFQETQDLANVVLNADAGLFVRHLGTVNDVLMTRNRLSRFDGSPAVILSLDKEAQVNPLELSKRVRKALQTIEEKTLPPGYKLTVVHDSSEIIRKLIDELTRLAMFGVVLAMLVLHAFVRSYRMTLIICLVIPISIVATFNAMYFSNMSINLITLVGLAIGVGSLLDNSIVVLENIARHRQRGMKPKEAAVVGASEVVRPIVALTATSIVVFLPIVFIEGELKMIFREGALAIVYPLLVSMCVALFLVPMTATYIFRGRMKVKPSRLIQAAVAIDRVGWGGTWALSTGLESLRTRVQFTRFRGRYLRLLKGCLRHRVRLVLALVAIILYTWFYTMAGIEKGGRMEPPRDRDDFSVYIFMPKGTRIEHSTSAADKVEDLIDKLVPEKKHTRSWIFEDFAEIRVEVVPQSERERTVPQIRESLRKPFLEFREAEVTQEFKRQRGSETPSPVIPGGHGSIELRGPDQESLMRMVEIISPFIQQVPGVRDVFTDLEEGELELRFRLDRDRANLLQITAQSVAMQIAAAQSQGDMSQLRMKRNNEVIDIIFQQMTEVPEDTRETIVKTQTGLKLNEMRRIPIFSPTMMGMVSLEDIGAFELVKSTSRIQRMNQQRIVRLIYSVAPNAKFRDVEESVKQICENYPLPPGFTFNFGGMSQEWEDLEKALNTVVVLALILVYMLMASLFESIHQPLVIKITILLGYVPIVWGLLWTETPMDAMAAFGCIFLIGILPNSGILLVNFASMMRRERHFNRPRAVFLACAYRIRPILMTVGTTVLGLAPMAIQTENGDAEWVPFAIVVISGLLGSTLLTLLLIPGFYFIFEDIWNGVVRFVRYPLSLRWMLVFWNRERRSVMRNELTAYRMHVPREEPLTVETWNLTRIYERPLLIQFRDTLARWAATSLIRQPVPVGIVAGAVSLGLRPETETPPAPTGIKALDGINLTIERGLFGLLGPNGAGKTTFIRLLVGIDWPTRGTCRVCGYDMMKEGSAARMMIGYLPQDFGVYGERSARDYLRYFAMLKSLKDRRERDRAVDRALEMVNLQADADREVGAFSGGMIRRLGLAQIFLNPPRIVVVDEPTAGLDPLERLRFRNLLVELAADRIVVFSTHIVEDIAHSCRQLAVMQQGRITYQGSRDGLLDLAENHVAEVVADDRSWRDLRRCGEVTGMQRTPEGVRIRFVFAGPKPSSARFCEPNLEDAYVYHTVVAPGIHGHTKIEN